MKPRSLGCVGLISLDGLLSIPDFRAGERVFQLLWSAAEAVVPTGRLVIQTRHPEHHVMTAIRTQDRSAFYMPEIEFRRELGYPPFRRLCLVSVRGRDPAAGRSLVEACAAALHGRAGITAYRPVALGGQTARPIRWQIVVKGAENLPRLLVEPLRPFLERSRQRGGVVEVEMDPVSFM
jgi:primosomal protein N' (replication factor Y) (superfamily II helicase)